MTKLFNLARMTTATTGTGTITLGTAVSGCLTFATAGVADGDTVSYGVKDGTDSEVGTGLYTATGTTLTRNVTKSTNSDAAIALSGTAEVFITARAEDFDLERKRQNFGLSAIMLSKLSAAWLRLVNLFALGFKGASDIANGIKTSMSSFYTVDAANGRVQPVLTDTYSTEVTTALNENSVGWSGYTMRMILPPGAAGNGDRLKITLTPPTAGTSAVISDVFVGHPGSGSAFDGTQVRAQFSGSNGVTLTAGGASVVSDPVTYAYDSTKSLMVAVRFTSGDSRRNLSLGGTYSFYSKAASAAADASGTSPAGFGTATSGRSDLVTKVEARTVAGGTGLIVVTEPQTTGITVRRARAEITYDGSTVPVLDTDITAELSCDGGANWTSASLKLVTTLGLGGRYVAETEEVACTSGSSFCARIFSKVDVYGIEVEAAL